MGQEILRKAAMGRGKGWTGFRGAAQPQLGTGIQERGPKGQLWGRPEWVG